MYRFILPAQSFNSNDKRSQIISFCALSYKTATIFQFHFYTGCAFSTWKSFSVSSFQSVFLQVHFIMLSGIMKRQSMLIVVFPGFVNEPPKIFNSIAYAVKILKS